MPNAIPLNPALPKNFDNTPNDKRPKAQLDAWWDHPYGVTNSDGTISVRCLNGGAWDRSSFLGDADNYENACVLAEAKQAKWVAMRSQPMFMHSFEPPFILFLEAQQPDYERTEVARFDTMDELNAYSNKSEVNVDEN